MGLLDETEAVGLGVENLSVEVGSLGYLVTNLVKNFVTNLVKNFVTNLVMNLVNHRIW